jgi:hypothetical protein
MVEAEWAGSVEFSVNFRCRLVSVPDAEAAWEPALVSGLSVPDAPSRLAHCYCHAEGRGFESLHPLPQSHPNESR